MRGADGHRREAESGRQQVERAGGRRDETESGRWQVEMNPGDVFVSRSPTGGGGGYGPAGQRREQNREAAE